MFSKKNSVVFLQKRNPIKDKKFDRVLFLLESKNNTIHYNIGQQEVRSLSIKKSMLRNTIAYSSNKALYFSLTAYIKKTVISMADTAGKILAGSKNK